MTPREDEGNIEGENGKDEYKVIEPPQLSQVSIQTAIVMSRDELEYMMSQTVKRTAKKIHSDLTIKGMQLENHMLKMQLEAGKDNIAYGTAATEAFNEILRAIEALRADWGLDEKPKEAT